MPAAIVTQMVARRSGIGPAGRQRRGRPPDGLFIFLRDGCLGLHLGRLGFGRLGSRGDIFDLA